FTGKKPIDRHDFVTEPVSSICRGLDSHAVIADHDTVHAPENSASCFRRFVLPSGQAFHQMNARPNRHPLPQPVTAYNPDRVLKRRGVGGGRPGPDGAKIVSADI